MWASAGTSVEANEATSRVGVAESIGKTFEPLPPGCRLPKVQGVCDRDLAWVIFFMDNAISVEVQWREDGVRCNALIASVVDTHFQTVEERDESEEPLLPRKNMTGWPTTQGILGRWVI